MATAPHARRPLGRAPLAAAVLAAVLPLASCGSGDPASGPFKACMNADTGGLKGAFSGEAYAGLKEAANVNPSITVTALTSNTAGEYAGNIAKLVSEKCSLVVAVGAAMAPAVTKSAAQNPSQKYVIVDAPSAPPRIKGLQFDTAQGAFLAGYLAAGMTRTGRVATYGGSRLTSVMIYMDGFWEGVQYYNREKNAKVQVLGWDEASQKGSLITPGNFNDPQEGRSLAQAFENEGADIVFPIAASATGVGTLAQAKASNGKLKVIWTDDDGFYSNPDYSAVIMTSVVKGIANAVNGAVTAAASGKFDAANYIGTLANQGTDIAPFHDFASVIPTSLASEINDTRQNIINGTIKITSPNQPALGAAQP